jgi:hypothetical protein
MAVQLDGKATEKQRKYLGVLSSQGKEKFGQDFSIRKMAEQQAIDWENMSMEEANKLIKEVKEMISKEESKEEIRISERDLMKRIDEQKKEEEKQKASLSSSVSTHTYMIQLVIPEDKLTALTVVLEAMNLGYILLQEVRA